MNTDITLVTLIEKVGKLSIELEEMRATATSYKMENENLRKENAYLRNHIWDEVEQARNLAVTKTVKKMMDRIEKLVSHTPAIGVTPEAIYYRISKIAKDVLEESK